MQQGGIQTLQSIRCIHNSIRPVRQEPRTVQPPPQKRMLADLFQGKIQYKNPMLQAGMILCCGQQRIDVGRTVGDGHNRHHHKNTNHDYAPNKFGGPPPGDGDTQTNQ